MEPPLPENVHSESSGSEDEEAASSKKANKKARRMELMQQQKNQKQQKKGKSKNQQGGCQPPSSTGDDSANAATEEPSLSAAADVEEPWEHDKKPPIKGPVSQEYCGVCGFPPEYCEYGTRWTECKQWIIANGLAHLAGLEVESTAGETGLENGMQKLSIDAQPKVDAPAEVPGASGRKKKTPDEVVKIQRVSRSKRKMTTVVTGLDLFGVKLEDAAKVFKKQFACGCSVVKSPGMQDVIEIQGDTENEIADVISQRYAVPESKFVFLPPK